MAIQASSMLVLNWEAWEGFLLREVLPDATLVTVEPYAALPDVVFELVRTSSALFINVDLSDCTHIFPNQSRLLRVAKDAGCFLCNRAWQDLDKGRLQDRLEVAGLPNVKVPANAPDDLAVIVKSRLNYGGESEIRLAESRGVPRLRASQDFVMGSRGYFVTTLSDVRAAIHTRAGNMYYERFVNDESDRFFRVYIAGIAVIVVAAHCKGAIKKVCGDSRDINCFTDTHSFDLLAANPSFGPNLADVVERFIGRFPTEFCSLDIVMDGSNAYIVDINTTPWCGKTPAIPEEISGYLRHGLAAFFDSR